MSQPPPPHLPHPSQPAAQGSGQPGTLPTWPHGRQLPPQPGWPESAPPARPGRRPNVVALVGLVVAGLMVLAGPAQQVAFQVGLGSGDGGASLRDISTAFGVLGLVLALVTLALGVVALVVPDRGRLLAAAVVGIGAASVVGAVLAFGTGVVLSIA